MGEVLGTSLQELGSPTVFAIVTRGRTGSTYLLSLLGSHPDIRTVGEPIGESVLRHETLKRRILDVGVAQHVTELLKRQGNERAVGLKILYYQVEGDYGRLWRVPDVQDVLQLIANRRDSRILHLKRKDRLRTIASMRVAAETQQYVLLDGQTPIRCRVHIPPHECAEEFERIEAWEQRFDGMSTTHELLQVTYEDVVSNVQGECRRILDFVGVARRKLHSRMRRQSMYALEDVISNYRELKEYFSGTSWARFFET